MASLLKAARVIDAVSALPMEHAAVLIEGDRIRRVMRQDELVDVRDAEIVDFGDATILPGLIDAHVHLVCGADDIPFGAKFAERNDESVLLRAAANAQEALSTGVTTLRDAGGTKGTTLALRRAIQDGVIAGPRLLSSGMPITITGGHCNFFGLEADTVDDVVRAVRSLVKSGVDCIKVMASAGIQTPGNIPGMAQYSAEILRVLVEEAHARGRRVLAHAHSIAAIRNAAEAGVDTIEHCSWVAPPDTRDSRSAHEVSVRYDPELTSLIAEKGIYVDPTMVAMDTILSSRGAVNAFQRRVMDRVIAHRGPYLRKMMQAGVKMLAGTDAGSPGLRFGDFVYGLEVMIQELEWTPMEAIVSATRDSAHALGLGDELGTIEPGKQADLLIVQGDPTKRIADLRCVRQVLLAGRVTVDNGAIFPPKIG